MEKPANRNSEESKLLVFAKNLTSVISDSLLSIMHSGITVYDPFGIEEQVERMESKATKTLFCKGKSELEILLYESRKKRMDKEYHSSSELMLRSGLKQDTSTNNIKKRKTSHQAWTNKQLIKVYGMRYTRSVRNLHSSFARSPKKHRLSSLTPTKL